MPIWLQMTASLSAALASGIMGAALVPFLQKMRFCEPEQPSGQTQETAENRLRPTMGGLLLVFGCVTGAGLAFALYRTFCILDSTSVSVQQELREIGAALCYTLLLAAMGFAADWRIVRRRPLRRIPKTVQFLAVFLLTGVFLQLSGTEETVLEFGFWRYDAGILYVPLNAAWAGLLWLARLEERTDGIQISVSGMILLGTALLMMQSVMELTALLAFSAAGACMGCLVWNLHPGKCRLGNTGAFWCFAVVTALSLLTHQHTAMLLLTAVLPLDRLPAFRRGGRTLQEHMEEAGMKPWQSIAVLAGFAAFCGIAAAL